MMKQTYNPHQSCQVRTKPWRCCGEPRAFFTNYMEPLCKDHFYQRKFIQELLVMLSGRGSWASLIVNSDEYKRSLEEEL